MASTLEPNQNTVFVTGGAGFIGSALIRKLIHETKHQVVNIDKLTYAGNLESLESIESSDRYVFEKVDICDSQAISALFEKYKPQWVFHLAAESHVDRSIDSAAEFIHTNIVGTHILLENSRSYFESLSEEKKKHFRFLNVSTDEVFGSLSDSGFFKEETSYDPSSPYSASKASADHLVRAWSRTYGFPALITNCSNNFGSFQFPEKLIPVVILNALSEKAIPIYGKGVNVRDWIYVDDHANALYEVMKSGKLGETYLVGSRNELTNLRLVEKICGVLDNLKPRASGKKYKDLIEFVKDRPGHDHRYAIDPSKIEKELGWKPQQSFEEALEKTVTWYLENLDWAERISSGEYRNRKGLKRVSA